MRRQINRSLHDHRDYRYFKLQNNIKVLVVKDEHSKTSSANCYVKSGSLNDPDDVNGIAHFCEHMLFLGTNRFPVENEYSQYLMNNGGSRNAATGEDYTTFYFDIKNECLEGAMERFSDFFKDPLFTESATEREINAIESEFKKN